MLAVAATSAAVSAAGHLPAPHAKKSTFRVAQHLHGTSKKNLAWLRQRSARTCGSVGAGLVCVCSARYNQLRFHRAGRVVLDSSSKECAASSTWREVNFGRLGKELEGWPCSTTRKRRSGHPDVGSEELRDAIASVGLGHRVGVAEAPTNIAVCDLADEEKCALQAKVRGVLRAALIRQDGLYIDEAFSTLGRLAAKRGLHMDQSELQTFAREVVDRALRFGLPSMEEAASELLELRRTSHRSPSAARVMIDQEDGSRRSVLSHLANNLLPNWVKSAAAENVILERLFIAIECWERIGLETDIEGLALYMAACLQLGDKKRLARALELLLDNGCDVHMTLQPLFLRCLRDEGLLSEKQLEMKPHTLPALVQRAALLARRGEESDFFLRRHGALLFTTSDAFPAEKMEMEMTVLAEGFNHHATPLGPRGPDPRRDGIQSTFQSEEEAAAAGLPPRLQRMRPAQRHAEVHCLLQVPEVAALTHQDTHMLVVELADVGPGFLWAEPCSRGCMQFLRRYGIRSVSFTNGQGALETRRLNHEPDWDVGAMTYQSSSRLSGDTVSERACTDFQEKLRREAAGSVPFTREELAAEGMSTAAVALREQQLPRLRGLVFPLPRRKGVFSAAK